MTPKIQSVRLGKGFTLVELLVSMAVLALLLMMISHMVNSATVLTTGSRSRMDADSQARVIFDRITVDFQGMLKRKDLDYIFSKQGSSSSAANDKMFFFSEVPAHYSNSTDPAESFRSPVALVGYRINTNYQLERVGKTLAWDGGGNDPGSLVYLSLPTGTTTPVSTTTLAGNWASAIGTAPSYSGTDDDYHIIAENVYRMEICFQVKDLTNPNAPKAAYSNYPVAYFGTGAGNATTASSSSPGSPKIGDRWYDTANNRAFIYSSVAGQACWQPLGVDDLLGVVIAIALIENKGFQIIADPSTGAIKAGLGGKMVAAFADPTDSDLQPASSTTQPKLMAETWHAALDSPGFGQSKIDPAFPQAASSGIRIYQRLLTLRAN